MLLITIVKYLNIFIQNSHNNLSDDQINKLKEANKTISNVINELDMEGYYDY